jgi:multimeric flavodoxin WrbA
MADHVVSACKDCLPWVCASTKKCTYEDPAFEFLSEKLLSCRALVFGTPIYWWDTSGMVRYFFLKMFRVFARSAPLQGLPAFGIGVAGGTGNGLVTGLRPLYQFFHAIRLFVVEWLPKSLPEAYSNSTHCATCARLVAQFRTNEKFRIIGARSLAVKGSSCSVFTHVANFDASIEKACQLGTQLASGAGKRTPFASLEERLLWYDNLLYLNLSRLEERMS